MKKKDKMTMLALAGALSMLAVVPVMADDNDPERCTMPGAMGMHDAGMGMGMMGGMGAGMMGGMHGGVYAMLNLSAEQRTKINQIMDDTRRKNWTTLGRIQDEKAKLRDLYAAEKRDAKAISNTVAGMQALQRQALEAHLDAQSRAEALLTEAQREQLKQFRSSGMGMYGAGMMGHGGYGPRGMMGR